MASSLETILSIALKGITDQMNKLIKFLDIFCQTEDLPKDSEQLALCTVDACNVDP